MNEWYDHLVQQKCAAGIQHNVGCVDMYVHITLHHSGAEGARGMNEEDMNKIKLTWQHCL